MITSVGLQYAKALFDLACNEHNENQYLDNLKAVYDVIINDQEVLKVFNHPRIDLLEKKEIIKKTFENYVSKEFLHFLYVVLENNRLNCLEDIIDSYQSYLNDYLNLSNVVVYSKYKLTEEETLNLKKKLEVYLEKKINLNINTDDNLIGGIVIKVDGKIIDASILNQMLDLKNVLEKGW